MHTRFDKIDEFSRVFNATKFLVLFGPKRYDAIYNKIRYLIGVKSDTTYDLSHYYAKIKVDSYDSLPVEKTLTLHNVIMHINSVLNKDQNHYDNIFLEKFSY